MARRSARPRRVRSHVLDTGRDVLADRGRHGVLHRGAGRARAQLLARVRRRVASGAG